MHDAPRSQQPELHTERDSPTGVDDFLILESLKRSPAERLRVAQQLARSVAKLANARRIVD